MSETDKEEIINSFVNITGVEKPRARLYLENAGWNLDLSISSFYEESDEMDEQQAAAAAVVPVEVDDDVQEMDLSKKIQNIDQQQSIPKSSSSSNRIATISSFVGEDNSSDEEGQRFYAGGSERSGQQVLGPKKKATGKDIVSEMFKAAKEHGAEVLDQSSAQPSSSKPRSSQPIFRGTGFKLGSSENDSEVVGASSRVSKTPSPIEMVLRLWKNGFSVDNGTLRDYQDPTNKEFLDSITRGEIPRELVQQSKGAEVSLNMEDHRHEEFKAPKQKVQAFMGEGHRLGSPAPTVTGENLAASANPKENEEKAQKALNLQDSEPTTSIQIRLADGSRVVAKVNHSHRISDLNRFIITARPQFVGLAFALMTTFPNKELTEENLTVKEADLLNAVIVQRLK